MQESPFELPPPELLARIGSAGPEGFALEGARIKECLLRCLPPSFAFSSRARILDFGCGSGRLLYQLHAEARDMEIWGCDIDRPSIAWLRSRLEPPFHLLCNEERPPLPFDAGSFDLVVALSVFTHLVETWREWLDEIHRLLRPGGVALLTFLGRKPWTHLGGALEEYDLFERRVLAPERPWSEGGPLVFHSERWIERHFTAQLAMEALFTEGLVGYQSVAVLCRPTPDAGPAAAIRRGQPFVFQMEGGGWRGEVDYDPLAPRSWWRECGCPRPAAELSGWILSEQAPTQRLWARAGGGSGIAIEERPREDLARALEGIPWASRCGFAIPARELPGRSARREFVRIGAQDRAGTSHELLVELAR